MNPHPTSLPRVSDAELATRQTSLLESASRDGMDGVIVWGRGSTNSDGSQNLLYLTNHMSAVSHIPDSDAHRARGHAGLVMAPGREPILVTDSYDISPEQVGVRDIRLTTFVDRDTARAAKEIGLQGRRVGLIGQTSLLHSAALCMAAELGPATELRPADQILTRLRLIKSAQEVALLKEASRIGCDWMQVMLDAAEPGRTEGEIVGEGLRWLAASGGWAYDVAIASGPVAHRYRHHQALPTWDSHRRLEPGDMLHMDLWGPVAHGYYCDLTRSTVVGAPPTAAQERLLDSAINVIETMIAAVEPGRPLSHLHTVGVQAMARAGGDASAFATMIPFVGHSLGLDCESPFITASAAEPITPGMVLALECFLGSHAGEAAGFEHVVHVGECAIEKLTEGAPSRPWLRNVTPVNQAHPAPPAPGGAGTEEN